MIWKLQQKTLLPFQIFGYVITLCIGITIVLTTLNIYYDIKPILEEETDVFGSNAVVITKKINTTTSLKGGINTLKGKKIDRSSSYFTRREIAEFEEMESIKKIYCFNRAAGFNIELIIDALGLRTDMFFESIPDKYLDIEKEMWNWKENENFIPIIIPKDYVKLLNFGFAETQGGGGIPLLSYNTIKLKKGNIRITNKRGQKEYFTCRIVGFTDKINSILVPDNFLIWANNKFGDGKMNLPNKILVEFNNPNNPNILKYINNKGYEINEKEIEFNKLINIFKVAFIFVFIIAITIISLSIAFILLSINLIFQKNKKTLVNLYNIGYRLKEISYFYKIIINSCTIISIISALILTISIRDIYRKNLTALFDTEINNSYAVFLSIILIITLVPLLNIMMTRKISKIIEE